MVKLVPLYGADIGVLNDLMLLKMFEINSVKDFLKLPANTSHVLARGECGRYPLFIDYYYKCIK